MRFYSENDIARFDNVSFVFIETEEHESVFKIILNRPEKRNAFTPTMAEEIVFALAYAHYSSHIRCVVLSARGPVFCAGADLNAFHDASVDTPNPTLPRPNEPVKLGDAFAQLFKPAIAQVEGAVLAGGFLLICGCTFVYTIPEAKFSLPEVKRGIWPMQVMASLSGLVADRKILEMAITGRSYSAMEALNMGLVTQLEPQETLSVRVQELAELIAGNAPLAIMEGMKAFAAFKDVATDERHGYLQEKLQAILLSKDAKEGVLAFREKRKPNWQGE
ncbi:enoyl-CoA hydratase/carnithine racemase [Dyadobacter jejuensis]|uniref:Enoyl-CoA hydratase/carnithine racemase n=1 Tax=Dyadobacter jejuensis TaxID=1082580 RepID=A0A316AUD4_9BACT|nr:enoyl-CoA hydratase-related protein [Dyadobacter jejuensis]PWJ60300.1 enoyl-CoA hydratase/carnithine racemase [Dyadobacter jejuensis]